MFLLRSIPFVAAVGALGLGSGATLAQASALSRAVAVSDHQQPAIPHPEQDATAAAAKLAAFEKRTGQKPNIVILLVDDMGYGDPGAFGGGEAIGAATPKMDRLAAEGLKLTSTYAQQTCTPTRSAMFTGRLPVRTGLTRPILAGDTITVTPWEGETGLARRVWRAFGSLPWPFARMRWGFGSGAMNAV